MELEKTIQLRKVVSIGDVVYEKLTLREPTAGELEKASHATSNTGVVINLVSFIAKVPRKVAEDICQRDFGEASDFFGQFATFQPTGETSSQN